MSVQDPRKAQSLYFCVAVTNPYFSNFKAQGALGALERPFRHKAHKHEGGDDDDKDDWGFEDGDYMDPHKSIKEKLVNMVRRMNAKGVEMFPSVLHTVVSEESLDAVKEQLFYSPDNDQIYILLHAEADVQKAFAQDQQLKLMTNPYSTLGGAATVFSVDLDKDLARSVLKYHEEFGNVTEKFLGKKEKDKYVSWGYLFDIPQRVRLFERVVKTPWEFGGCGLAMDEMIREGMLAENFFLLHNMEYAKRYGLDKWASVWGMFSLSQPIDGIRKYFGEKVAMYFLWLETYTKFLFIPVVPGLAMTSYGLIHQTQYNNSFMALFSAGLICWSVVWIRRWEHVECRFAMESGADVETQQEMPRDEFVGAEESVGDDKIHRKLFQFPLTLYRRPNGELVERKDSPIRRALVRGLVTYPITLALVGGLVVSLLEVTTWRFNNASNSSTTILASVATTIIMKVFGMIFDKLSVWLNDLENNRTDTEYENSLIMKSFLFFFCNAYSALFIIVLYPHSDIDNKQRFEQLSSQMVIILLVMPAVQNFFEVLLPIFNARLRIRTDLMGSAWKAFWSIICGCGKKIDEEKAKDDFRHELWLEAQKEPFTTIAGDYLEIILQFGYMTLFSCAFPWAPAAAFVFNVMEIRIDAVKFLYHTQRPRHVPVKSIGSWNFVFRFLVGISIITNAYLVCFMSVTFQDLEIVKDDLGERTRMFVYVQYVFVFIVMMVLILVPIVPMDVLKENAMKDILQQRFNLDRVRLKKNAYLAGFGSRRPSDAGMGPRFVVPEGTVNMA